MLYGTSNFDKAWTVARRKSKQKILPAQFIQTPFLLNSQDQTFKPHTMIKSDTRPDRATLEKREMEIQQIMRQMKSDELHNSPVYQKLERELLELKNKLIQIP